jgi:hypothetical protein
MKLFSIYVKSASSLCTTVSTVGSPRNKEYWIMNSEFVMYTGCKEQIKYTSIHMAECTPDNFLVHWHCITNFFIYNDNVRSVIIICYYKNV